MMYDVEGPKHQRISGISLIMCPSASKDVPFISNQLCCANINH